MENPWPHRYAILVAVCTALLFITGPVVTSKAERPLYSLGLTHAWMGTAVTILMAGLAFWLSRSKEPSWLRRLAWVALAANAIEDLVAFDSGALPSPVKIAHTLLGQLFFSATVVVAVFTSQSWNQIPKPVQEGSRLRRLTMTTAELVFLQVILGAVLRNGVTGSLPHILGAVVVAVFLAPAMAELFRAQHPDLRSAGIALTMAASLQILLGFALLTIESLDLDPEVILVTTSAHVTLGSLTLAAAVVVAILVRRVTASSK
jgi:heme A synthase